MKIFLIVLLILNSCQDFSALQIDRENVMFFKNISSREFADNNDLTVVTYNIKFGFCSSCSPFRGAISAEFTRLDSIAELINSMNVDIISLQEVGYEYDLSIVDNQIEYLAQKTNMNYTYGMSRALQTGDNLFINGFQGNALLTKFEIKEISNHPIRFIDYYNQNRCLKSVLKIKNRRITILNTHFESGSTSEEKELQIKNIIDLAQKEKNPVIFMGDLNMGRFTPSFTLFNKLFYNTYNQLSVVEKDEIYKTGTFYRGSIIDHIFVDKKKFIVKSGKVPINYNLSDHYPYQIKLKLK